MLKPFERASDIVPENLDATKWENVEPLYNELLQRDLHCPKCLERLLLDRSELDAAVYEARSILYINMSCRTDDESATKAYLDFVENVEPKLKQTGFELDRKIVNSPFADQLDKQRYGVLLRTTRADVEIFRPENVELETELSRLSQQYEQICGAMTVDFRGEQYTMPQMARFAEETDRASREEAWRAVAQRRHDDHRRLTDIFNKMILLRHKIARNADFENYRDYMFKAKHRFDYTPEDCHAFAEGVEKHCVPVLRRLSAERAQQLGVDTLRPWDLSVDIKGRPPLRPFEGAKQLIDTTSRIFHKMDPALGSLFDALQDGDCLDLESRRGKAPGGYQAVRQYRRKPFIFMNAAGLNADVVTMLHEAGHAFHSMLCRDDPLLQYRAGIPTEFAEVASMTMELTAHPYLEEFYRDGDADRARRIHLERLATLLAWIATIDQYQHWLYTNPDHTPEQREDFWIALDQRFGPGADWAGLEHFRRVAWQRQLHLFRVPFYYIEYGIAQLGALQLWRNYKNDPADAIASYKRAMTLGASRPLPELFETAGLKFDFGPGTIHELMSHIGEELERLPA